MVDELVNCSVPANDGVEPKTSWGSISVGLTTIAGPPPTIDLFYLFANTATSGTRKCYFLICFFTFSVKNAGPAVVYTQA